MADTGNKIPTTVRRALAIEYLAGLQLAYSQGATLADVIEHMRTGIEEMQAE